MRHCWIGTEHILLGLLREEEGLGARVLESMDITVEEARRDVLSILKPGEEHVLGQIPFTPRAKKVLELSMREALSLGHNYIGTEHILLGLVRENEGVAARVLYGLGADAEEIRNEVIRMLSGSVKAVAKEPLTLLTEAVGSVLPYLVLSTEDEPTVDHLLVSTGASPAAQLRLQAAAIEKRDAAIKHLRALLEA